MPEAGSSGGAPSWDRALLAARLFAVQPGRLVLHVRSGAGPTRAAFLQALREPLPATMPVLRCPVLPTAEALLGELDLSATLLAARPVWRQGLLDRSVGGVLLVASAERLTGETAALLCGALDAEHAPGLDALGLVLLDEGEPDEALPAVLLDRVAIRVELDGIRAGDAATMCLAAARRGFRAVRCPDPVMDALCHAAEALGIAPLRATLLAARIARAAASLAGRAEVDGEDAALAAGLVLAPRATRLPVSEPPAENAPHPEPAPSPEQADAGTSPANPGRDQAAAQQPEDVSPTEGDAATQAASEAGPAPEAMQESVLAAAAAAVPAGLLDRGSGPGSRITATAAGRNGHGDVMGTRGRPLAPRRGTPNGGNRLALVETLRSAAPWQRSRRAAARPSEAGALPRLLVRGSDLHVIRCSRRPRSTAIFLVDASGSAALHRLAEAKGAIELLLGECYVRRDRVALLVFRGGGTELLLPPTGALARARRSLAAMTSGGGTPLAAGLDAAILLASGLRRRGESTLIVTLTDGRANIARDGTAGRVQAGRDATESASRLRAAGLPALLVDIAPRAQPKAEGLAAAMGAPYLHLARSEPALLSRAVRALVA
ncbi:VWA domain-containing protein [Lichenicola sp.]|uniref:VWA domain-containing protein n=1 Tax=Lichenicola sp. TaxID=2804529 RepID=UPI003AFF679F